MEVGGWKREAGATDFAECRTGNHEGHKGTRRFVGVDRGGVKDRRAIAARAAVPRRTSKLTQTATR